MIATVGAVRKHLAGVVGQRVRTGFAIIDIGRGDRHLLDQRCIGIGTDMGLEAMNCTLSLMFYPTRIIIVLAGRCIIVASTSVPVLTVTAFDLSCIVTTSNSERSSLCATSSLRYLTKAVRSGVASFAENPQKRRNEARSSSASASFTSDKSYQIERSRALKMASGGLAGSPLVAQ